MNIPDVFLENIQIDPMQTAASVCEYILDAVEQCRQWGPSEHNLLLEGYAFITAMQDEGLIEFRSKSGNVGGARNDSCPVISTFLTEVHRELQQQLSSHQLESLKKKFANIVSNVFAYEFTEGDVTRIQTLINELRGLLATDSGLDDGHKQRLLKRLEELQKELHKKVSDLSRFYSLMGDFGVAVGKLGNDAKPFTDRIGELLGFAWKAQARAEQLPSSAENPMLGHEGEPPRLG